MASDDDDGYTPREPLTPLYNPSGNTPAGGRPTPGPRTPRNGPLGARLSQRGKTTQPPNQSGETAYTPFSYTPGAPEAGETAVLSGDYVPASPESPTWGRVTGLLKLDEKVTGTLHADLQFGATWSSRSEMLRSCLDEYYRLVASYNEARRLLELSDGDIEALRREQTAASARLREVESRLEFHSRTELRAVYLGAAETETRLFRAEEERDLLRSRAELLEGFMAFLSRIIATVRAIPPNVTLGANPPTPVSNGEAPRLPADAHPDETLLYKGPKDNQPQTAQGAATAPTQERAARGGQEIEELILNENEVALLASSEFEIIEILDDESNAAGKDAPADSASMTARSSTGNAAGAIASETSEAAAESAPDSRETGASESNGR